jgi:putative transposase
MDVHVRDATRRVVIGRPWLAALIDVKSRMILGYSLTFEDPSVLSAMSCIRAAMRGMPEMKQRFPKIDGQWEAFGVPRTILADNAWENTGSSFVDACADCGISIEWAPVRRPEYKGILERFFSRLDDQLVHKLPGAVVDNPVALRERRIDPQSDAILTLQELDELIPCRNATLSYVRSNWSQRHNVVRPGTLIGNWPSSARRWFSRISSARTSV